MHKKLKLITLFSLMQQIFPALAQTAEPSALEKIVILSQRTSDSVARKAQEEAPNLINILTADEMRKLPDVNIAEAVRRLPGISLETDTGEGRFINIRGIDSDLNSTTFGGLRLPPSNNASPFGGGRAVALDAIPSGLVGAITVTKTNLPEQDAESIGGTIEITPKTISKDGKFFFNGHIGTGYEPLRGTPIQDLSFSTGGKIGSGTQAGQLESFSDKPLSVIFTYAAYQDKRGIDDVEPAFIDDGVNPKNSYAGWEQRYYQYNRNRQGTGIELGLKPSSDNSYYFRAFDVGYTETVLRNRLIVTPDGSPTLTKGNVFTDGLSANGFDKTLRDEKEKINNKVYVIGGKNIIDDKTLDYRLGMTQGSYHKLYDYNSDFNYTPDTGTVVYTNTNQGNTPSSIASGVKPLNMSNYSLVKFTNAIQDINDREYSLAANLKLPVNWFSQEEETFKLGYSDRQRTRDVSGVNFSYKNLPNLTAAQASYGGNVNFYNSQYDNGPNLTPGYLQNLLANNQYISNSNAINNALQYQNDKENVFATYGQYQTKINNIGIIGGLRFEGTNATYAANAKGVNAQQNTIVSPVSQNAKYNNLFPSLQARIDLKDSTILRVAYSSTIARPGFNEVTPSLNIDPSANQVVQGNPNLKPTTSNAFDLAYEHYLPAAGIFSVGFFDKEISNYIAPSRTDATFPNNGLFAGFVGIAHVVSYSNIANSHARGFELNYYEHLKNLPESLDGLGIGFNYTYVDSKFQIRPGEFSTLPSTSKNTVNGTLFYETDHLNLRLGLYYLSSNLWAIGSGDTPDTFSAPRFNVDFGGSYIFDKQYSLYFNIKNINNTPLTFYEGTPDRVIQREFYGPTYQFGLKFAL